MYLGTSNLILVELVHERAVKMAGKNLSLQQVSRALCYLSIVDVGGCKHITPFTMYM